MTNENTYCCKPGEYMCEVLVLYPLGRNRLISVDRCMVPELQSLWLRGIKTGGCCCGHFEKDGFIQVMPEHESSMLELGYEKIPAYDVDGQRYGEGAFKPKTQLEFHGYGDFTTELEQRYEQLKKVARDMYQKLWGNAYNEDPTLAHELRKNMADIRTEQYREQLEQLGVSLDD